MSFCLEKDNPNGREVTPAVRKRDASGGNPLSVVPVPSSHNERTIIGEDVIIEGTISRMLDHGVIVEMGEDLEGFVPLGHLAVPKLDKPQYYFREEEKVDLKVIKMDVENRRIVLSVAEYFKRLEEAKLIDEVIGVNAALG